MNLTRRAVIDKVVKGSVLTLAYSIGGASFLLTPEEARAQRLPLKMLNADQMKVLEKLAEAIVPGSVKLGVTHFVDYQLNTTPEDCLLIAKYLQAPLPYSDFYATGLKAASTLSQRSLTKPIDKLSDSELESLVKQMSQGGAAVDGYPIFLFYLCLRSDAVDVTYGTPEGFKKLNVPYMEHILPPETWNA